MHVFPIRTYPWRALIVAALGLTGLPLAAIVLALIYTQALPNWLFISLIAMGSAMILAVNLALIVLTLFVATRNEITIRKGTMHLKGGEFHERVPLDAVEHACVVDIAQEPELAGLSLRNGITLPGFRVGWYQARGATDPTRKLFVIRAARARAVHVRTRIRFDVLLGVDEPEALAQRLLSNTVDDRD